MYEDLTDAFYIAKYEAKAEKMAAYMKNKFAYLGIPRPQRDALQSGFIKEARKKDVDWELVIKLWDMPEREFQYLAMDYIDSVKKKLKEEDLMKIKELIGNKSWWDTVDFLAAVIVGDLCGRYPGLKLEMLLYADSSDIWLKRTAILFQLKYKDNTDTELLEKILDKCCGTKEFFLNKAIGWALREYSKTDAEWVRRYIQSRELHSLSIREGSKYI